MNAAQSCQVPTLPDASALATIAKLPDPFKKLDGTRIATKVEWPCQREAIKKQAEKFIYGEKPPKPASVTGTVSSGTPMGANGSRMLVRFKKFSDVNFVSVLSPGSSPEMLSIKTRAFRSYDTL